MSSNFLFEREKRWLLDEKYDGAETEEYLQDLASLQFGTPVDYLIGHREFLGCQIDLSHHPLIPRNETEYWVKMVIDTHKLGSRTSQLKILDMFSGSGCVGIALLQHLSDCTVDFVEKNPAFVEQIQKNLEINRIDPSRYAIHQSDMFENLPLFSGRRKVVTYLKSLFTQGNNLKYDLIVANPPYIARNRVDTVQNSVHAHEDHDSLYADDNGLYFIKQLIDHLQARPAQALPGYLAPGGSCYIEYDPWQTDLIVQYLDTHHPSLQYQIIGDQFEKNRVIKIVP